MSMQNPIFIREFQSVSRSWKIRFIIGLYLLILGGMLLILWPSGGVQSVVTDSAKKIFSMFFSVNLVLLLLMIPAISAGSITSERERGTYPALFTTLLTPFEILWGKLAASSLMIVIMTLLSLPVVASCALAGGVDGPFILRTMVLLLCTALTYGILGLACSSLCHRTTSAVLLTYVLVLLFTGATWLPSALLSNVLPDFSDLFQQLRSISPFDALWYLLYPDLYRQSLSSDSPMVLSPYVCCLLSLGVLSVLGLLVFHRHITRPGFRSKRQQGDVYSDTKQALKRTLTFPFYLFDPLKRKKPIGRGRNPIYVAEMRSKLFANTNFVIRTVSVIFILTLGLLTLLAFQLSDQLHVSSVRLVAIVFEVGIVALLAPGIASGLVTDEITGGTFEALRMTPISPMTIIFGKLQATFFYAMIFLVSSIFILLAMMYLEPNGFFPDISPLEGRFYTEFWARIQDTPDGFSEFLRSYRTIWLWLVILLLSTLTFLSAGLFCSSFARSTFQATGFAYAITGIICVVTLLPLPLAEKFSYGASYVILSFNPIVAAMQITSGSFAEYPELWLRNILSLVVLLVFFMLASIGRVYYLFKKQH